MEQIKNSLLNHQPFKKDKLSRFINFKLCTKGKYFYF